jgi:hypothetical protein
MRMRTAWCGPMATPSRRMASGWCAGLHVRADPRVPNATQVTVGYVLEENGNDTEWTFRLPAGAAGVRSRADQGTQRVDNLPQSARSH